MTKTKIIVRLATRKDRLGIREVNEKSLPVGYDEKTWETMISQKLSFVAVASGLVVGYIVGNKDGCIVSFAVLETYRGKGLGKRLMLQFIEHMREAKYKQLILRVKVSNTIAQKLYLSMGFKQISILDKYYDNKEDGYLMQLDLDSSS